MKIYTKKGDGGETGLLGGVRVSKSHVRVESYGDVDELVSMLGVIRSQSKDDELNEVLGSIQLELFFVGSELATPANKKVIGETLADDCIEALEALIDRCDDEMPPLKSFILPGGSPTAAQLQLARTICRRAERSVVRLQEVDEVRPLIVKYLNRLSDTLFALGRRANYRDDAPEVLVSELRRLRQTQP